VVVVYGQAFVHLHLCDFSGYFLAIRNKIDYQHVNPVYLCPQRFYWHGI
jgi:hypothetical protein